MVQKILTLGEQDWLSGLCPSENTSIGGLFYQANGLDIAREPGFLMAGFNPTDIGGKTVVGTIKKFVSNLEGVTHYLYGVDDSGRVYKINTGTDAVSNISSSLNITSSVGNGLEIYNDYLIYIKNTEVRKYGLLSGTPSDSSVDVNLGQPSGVTLNHPSIVHPNGNLYIADYNSSDNRVEVDMYDGTNYYHNVLNLPKEDKIIKFATDGYYLIILTSTNPSNPGSKGKSKILFWDTTSDSFNRQYIIPGEYGATNMFFYQKTNSVLVFTPYIMYETNYDIAPREYLKADSLDGMYSFNSYGVDYHFGNLLFSYDDDIYMYGSPYKGVNNVVWSPVSGVGTGITALKSVLMNRIYVASASNKLYCLKTGQQSGVMGETHYIDLRAKWKITGVKLVTSLLASGQSVGININEMSGLNNIIQGSFGYSTHGAVTSGKILTQGTGKTEAEQIQIQITLNGNVKLKRLEVWGEPIKEF